MAEAATENDNQQEDVSRETSESIKLNSLSKKGVWARQKSRVTGFVENKTKDLLEFYASKKNNYRAPYPFGGDIEKEFINYDELKELLSSLKYDKSELIKLLYELIILCLNNENIILKNTKYLSKKASIAGFDWSDSKTCFKKVQEEILEL